MADVEVLRLTVDADQPVKILDRFGRVLKEDIPKAAAKSDKSVAGFEKTLGSFNSTLGKLEKQFKEYQTQTDKVRRSTEQMNGAAGMFNTTTGKTPLIVRGVRRSLILLASEVVGITAAFRAFTSTITVGSEFDRGINRLRGLAQVDLKGTDAEFGSLVGTIRELGRTTEFTANQVREGAQSILLLSGDVEQTAQVLRASIPLANLLGESFERTGSLIQQTLSQFQLEASESARVASIFGNAIVNSAADVDFMSRSLPKFAGQFREFGGEIEEATAAMSLLSTVMKDTPERAGTGFKTFLATIADRVSDVKKKVQDLGGGFRFSELFDVRTGELKPMEQVIDRLIEFRNAFRGQSGNIALANVFGREAAPVLFALTTQLEDGTSAYKRYLDIQKQVFDLQSVANKVTDDLTGSWNKFKSAIEDIQITILQIFGPSLKTMIDNVRGFVNSLTFEDIENFGKAVQVAGIAMGTFAAFFLTRSLLTGITSMLTGIKTLTTAILGFNVAVSSNLVIAGIAATTAAVVGLYILWQSMSDGTKAKIKVFWEEWTTAARTNTMKAFGFIEKWGVEVKQQVAEIAAYVAAQLDEAFTFTVPAEVPGFGGVAVGGSDVLKGAAASAQQKALEFAQQAAAIQTRIDNTVGDINAKSDEYIAKQNEIIAKEEEKSKKLKEQLGVHSDQIDALKKAKGEQKKIEDAIRKNVDMSKAGIEEIQNAAGGGFMEKAAKFFEEGLIGSVLKISEAFYTDFSDPANLNKLSGDVNAALADAIGGENGMSDIFSSELLSAIDSNSDFGKAFKNLGVEFAGQLQGTGDIITQGVFNAGPNAQRVGGALQASGGDPIKAILSLVLSNKKIQEAIDRVFGIFIKQFDRIVDPFADILGSLLDVVDAMVEIANLLSGFDILIAVMEDIARGIKQLTDGIVNELGKLKEGAITEFQNARPVVGGAISRLTGGEGTIGDIGASISGQVKDAREKANKQLTGEVNSFLEQFYLSLEDESAQRQRAIEAQFEEQIRAIKKSDASQKVKDELKVATRSAEAVGLASEGFFSAAIDMARQAATTAGASSDTFQKTMIEIRKAQGKFVADVVSPSIDIIEAQGLDDLQLKLKAINKEFNIQREALADVEPEARDFGLAIIAQAQAIEEAKAEEEDLRSNLEKLADALNRTSDAASDLRKLDAAIFLKELEASGQDMALAIAQVSGQLEEQSASMILQLREGLAKQRGISVDELFDLGLDDPDVQKLIEQSQRISDVFSELRIQEIGKIKEQSRQAEDAARELRSQTRGALLDIINDADLTDTEIKIKQVTDRIADLRDAALEANKALPEQIRKQREKWINDDAQKALDIELTKITAEQNKAIQDLIDKRKEEAEAIRKQFEAFAVDVIKSDLSDLGKTIVDINKKYSDALNEAQKYTEELGFTTEDLASIAKLRGKEIRKAIDNAFKPFLDDLQSFRKSINQFRGDLVGATGPTLEELAAKASILQNLGDEGLLNETELRRRRDLMNEIFEQTQAIASQQVQADSDHERAVNRISELTLALQNQVSELLLSEFNVAGPQEKFDEANRQFEDLNAQALAAAQTTSEADDFAITTFQDFAETFLTASQNLFKSGKGHVENFDKVIVALQEVEQVASAQTATGLEQTKQSTEAVLQSIISTLDEVAVTLGDKVTAAAEKLIDINIDFGGDNITTIGDVPVYNSEFEIILDVIRTLDGTQVPGTVGNTVFEIIADIDRIARGGYVNENTAIASYQLVADITRAINDPGNPGATPNGTIADASFLLRAGIDREVTDPGNPGAMVNGMITDAPFLLRAGIDREVVDSGIPGAIASGSIYNAPFLLKAGVVRDITDLANSTFIDGDTANMKHILDTKVFRDHDDPTAKYEGDTLFTKLGLFGEVVKKVNGETVEGINAKNQLMNMLGTVKRFVTVGNTTEEITSLTGEKVVPMMVETALGATVNGDPVNFNGSTGKITFDISASLQTGFSLLNSGLGGLALGIGNAFRTQTSELTKEISANFTKLQQTNIFGFTGVQAAVFDSASKTITGSIQDVFALNKKAAQTTALFGSAAKTIGSDLETVFSNVNAKSVQLSTFFANLESKAALEQKNTMVGGVSINFGPTNNILNEIARTSDSIDGWVREIHGKVDAVRGAIENIQFDKKQHGGLIIGASHSQGGVVNELEGGEFVINKEAVSRIGVPALNALNTGTGFTGASAPRIELGAVTGSATTTSGEDVTRKLTETNARLDRLTQVLIDKDTNPVVRVDIDGAVQSRIREGINANNSRIKSRLERNQETKTIAEQF